MGKDVEPSALFIKGVKADPDELARLFDEQKRKGGFQEYHDWYVYNGVNNPDWAILRKAEFVPGIKYVLSIGGFLVIPSYLNHLFEDQKQAGGIEDYQEWYLYNCKNNPDWKML